MTSTIKSICISGALTLVALLVLFAVTTHIAFACPNWQGNSLCYAGLGQSFGPGGPSFSHNGQALVSCGGGEAAGNIANPPVCVTGGSAGNPTAVCGGQSHSGGTPVLPPAVSVPIAISTQQGGSSVLGSFPSSGSSSAASGGGSSQTPPPPPAQLSISAVPGLVSPGGSTTLTWGSQNASACTVTGPFVDLATQSGSQIVEDIIGRSTYTFACLGVDGLNYSAQTTVHVVPQWQEF